MTVDRQPLFPLYFLPLLKTDAWIPIIFNPFPPFPLKHFKIFSACYNDNVNYYYLPTLPPVFTHRLPTYKLCCTDPCLSFLPM